MRHNNLTSRQKRALRLYTGYLREFLREVRENQGISQEDVAVKARLGTKVVGRIERGENEPRLSTILLIGQGLGLTPEEMFEKWSSFLQGKELKTPRKLLDRFFSEDGKKQIEIWEDAE